MKLGGICRWEAVDATAGNPGYRGPTYFTIAGQKLARLGKMAVTYQWDVDENGNGEARFWEWK